MLTFTLVVSLCLGIILCFLGFRFFRMAMAIAGFAIGAGIGYYIYGYVAEYLPETGSGIWLVVFMGVGGLLVGFLSFAIFKAALFYISALITAFIIIKTFLMTMAGGVGVAAFIKLAFGKSPVSESTDKITGFQVADKGTVGELISEALTKLPGDTPTEKMLAVLVTALIAGVIVGIIVCVLQKPAIIIVTAVMGGVLASQGLCSMLDSFDQIDLNADTVITNFSVGSENLVLSTLLTVVLIVAGILVQFKTTKDLK